MFENILINIFRVSLKMLFQMAGLYYKHVPVENVGTDKTLSKHLYFTILSLMLFRCQHNCALSYYQLPKVI